MAGGPALVSDRAAAAIGTQPIRGLSERAAWRACADRRAVWLVVEPTMYVWPAPGQSLRWASHGRIGLARLCAAAAPGTLLTIDCESDPGRIGSDLASTMDHERRFASCV